MRERPDFTEADVAVAAEKWLTEQGYAVHREVRDGYGGARADLVGLLGRVTHVVECKTRLSLDLIEQAHAWLGRSHLVSVCVPKPKDRYARHPVVVLRTLGIGLLEGSMLVKPEWSAARRVVVARWHRVPHDPYIPPVSALLHDEQRRMGTAGTKDGGYYTAFRHTMEKVAEYVSANPGCTVREVMQSVEHHYGSDRGARHGLVMALRQGHCPGVEAEYGPSGAYLLRPSRETAKEAPRA